MVGGSILAVMLDEERAEEYHLSAQRVLRVL